MNQTKVKNYLEISANVAVILVAISMLGTFAWRYFAPARQVNLQSGLQKGGAFATVENVDYSKSPKTLLLAMNTNCDYCNESIPFYKRLSKEGLSNNKSPRIIAVFPNTEEEVKRYTQQHEFNVETVSGVDFNALHLTATPAMVLIDKDGKILNFWFGKPKKTDEEQIAKALSDSEE